MRIVDKGSLLARYVPGWRLRARRPAHRISRRRQAADAGASLKGCASCLGFLSPFLFSPIMVDKIDARYIGCAYRGSLTVPYGTGKTRRQLGVLKKKRALGSQAVVESDADGLCLISLAALETRAHFPYYDHQWSGRDFRGDQMARAISVKRRLCLVARLFVFVFSFFSSFFFQPFPSFHTSLPCPFWNGRLVIFRQWSLRARPPSFSVAPVRLLFLPSSSLHLFLCLASFFFPPGVAYGEST